MASIEYQGMKFSGGKFFIILSLIGTISGGGWSLYKFIDDYLELKTAVSNYISPDLSHYDEQLAVLKSEVDMILGEITLVNDVTQSLGTNIKTDIRNMNNDIRHITEIVNDIEDRQKEDSRELLEELKLIEDDIDLKINKALSNPLSGMSAKTK
ncbi:conserved Plasmodium protein [uncultured Mediterranean phage uvMED]|nr:conserved Plasmodium protein [uncultured Mediterranean phage uvMED]